MLFKTIDYLEEILDPDDILLCFQSSTHIDDLRG